MPDISSTVDGPGPLVVVRHFYSVEDSLGCRDLIRPHDEQEILGGEYAIFGEHIQQGVLGEEGLGEIDKVGNDLVLCIGPVAGEGKAVARLLALVRS